jgi:hypothetical protein
MALLTQTAAVTRATATPHSTATHPGKRLLLLLLSGGSQRLKAVQAFKQTDATPQQQQ